jgi:hypothetical protein
MSLTKLSLGVNNLYMTSLFPPRESLVSGFPAGDGNIEKPFLRCVPVSGIQGQDIGDVKFNQDGDAMGRYSVYQYQQVENTHDPKGEKRFVRARYVRNAHILIEYLFRSRILGRNQVQKS